MRKIMQVVLLKNVEKLGEAGDIVEVNTGHARNFLFPKELAKVATPEIIEEIKAKKEKQAKVAEADLVKTEKLAQALDGQEVEISAKASGEGTLFGSITSSKIVSALEEKSFEISKDQIPVEHIKEVGEHEVTINLAHGLEARITVIVSAGEEQ